MGLGALALLGLVTSTATVIAPAPALSREPDHVIRLKHLHTGETGIFTYKRNGRYDKAELAKINYLLRDWRKNQQVTIDPQLLDLIWGVYQQTGATGYIDIVCGYRSPATNSMLRSRSRGVAQHSQHTLGKAIDFYIPGVPLAKLRETAMKVQGGGVGYYPTSGSPFVHMDTGNVRAWPRMTRSQLIALFPNGNTLHLPADGKPLPGYERALAARKSGETTALAYLDAGDTKKSGNSWLKRVFSGGADQAEDDADAGVSTSAPATAAVPANPAPLPGAPPAAPEAAPDIVAAPETAVAALEPAADPARVPRARPPSDAEAAIAAISGLPGQPAADPFEPVDATASLAYAPVPRSRPGGLADADPTAPAASLAASGVDDDGDGDGDGAADLADASDAGDGSVDALAILAAQADAQTPDEPAPAAASPRSAAAGIQVASVDPHSVPGPATLVYTPDEASASAPASTRASAPLAFTGSGLAAPADAGAADAPPATVDRFLIAALEARAETKRAELRALADPQAATSDDKVERIRAAAALAAAKAADRSTLRGAQTDEGSAVSGAFSGFSTPQPGDATSLFAQPASADAVSDPAGPPKLPAGRFSNSDPAPAAPSPARDGEPAAPPESFLTRLFASLAQ